ncbi:MAG: GNAT family N-acetyltransferase [Sciscionella sp.]
MLPLIDATTSLNAPPGGSPQRRRGLTRRRGALNALGTVAVDRVTIPERLRDEVPRFVADRLNQWRQRGRLHELPAADRHPRFGEFLATAAAALASRGQCFLNRLLLDGRPLARGLYFRTGRTDLLYMSTYVLDYAKYSPSHLLLLDSAEIAMREGITTIELGRGDEQYKFDLGAESRYLRDVIR